MMIIMMKFLQRECERYGLAMAVGAVLVGLSGLGGCSGGQDSEERAAAIEAEVNAVPRPESWDGIEVLVRRQIEGALRQVIEAGTDEAARGRGWISVARSYHANDLIDLALPLIEALDEPKGRTHLLFDVGLSFRLGALAAHGPQHLAVGAAHP